MSSKRSLSLTRSREFVRLWSSNSRSIFAYIVSIVPHMADAEDVFQETGVTLWEKFSEYKSGTDFTAWGCRIAWYKMLSNSKLKKRWCIVDDALHETVLSETIEMTDLLDLQHEALQNCIQKLSLKDRNLLAHRYQDEESVKQIASSFKRSCDAIYKSLQRIHNTLYDCVNREITSDGMR